MGEALKLLIVEDSEDEALLLVRHLKKCGLDSVTRRVETVASLRSALSAFQWDAILCDVSMPNLDALGALEVVRSTGIDVPFIVVSGTVPEERLVELMKGGAHDVVVKDRLSRLVPAIEREIEEVAVRREGKRVESQLHAAMESISEGFTLFDAQDRLVLYNEAYRKLYEKSANLIVSGATFEEIVRGGAERGQYEQAEGRVEEFVRERMARHRACGGPFEQKLSDGLWVLVDERRTRDGGIIGICTDISGLKDAEQNLRHSEAFLRLIADNLPIVVAYFDTEQRYRFVNQTVTLWYARPKEEIIGKSVAEMIGKAGYASLETHLDRALQGHSEGFEASVAYPDGVTRQIQGIYVPDRDSEGAVRGFVTMAIDITDRHRAERALCEREEFIQLVVDNMAEALITINERCEIENFNGSAEQLFGYSASEVLGRNVAMLMPEPYHSRHDAYVAAYLRSGQGAILGMGPREVVGLRKDGSTFPLELSIGEVRQGELRVFVGTIRDLSARKKAELAIRESEERFRVAFETAPHGIALVGLDGRWLKVNRAAIGMLGYEEKELLGTDFQTVTHPDDIVADLDLARQVLDGKIRNYQMEKRYIRKDGGIVPALLSVSLVRDTDSSPIHFVVQILDLTKRKDAEEKLRQAQKMEAVGQLTGGVAHDFNNLLTVMMGNARLLERALAGDEDLQRKAEAIAKAAKRGADLTHRLLAFSRKQALNPEIVDLGEVVEGMLDLLRRTLGEAIEVKTSVAAKPCQAFVDPGELEHALLNLAVNAKDAMPGGGTISIKIAGKTLSGSDLPAGADIAPGAYVVLTVSDTGTGIAKQHLSQIFEPFFTTKEVGKGTGLGLSMVYGFAKQSGGQVIVDSEPGGGTSFHLYLPGAEAAAKADEPAGAEDPLDALSTGRATILVVEDEEAVRDFAVSVLEAHGYRIIEAEDGLQALAILRGRDDIDLLFTDMVMPGGMSGWDLAAEAARLHPGLKVLFTSGYSSEMADSACAAERGADLIRKPYDDNEVVRGVATALVA